MKKYIFKKRNGDTYARITRSKKACFKYFYNLSGSNIDKLCLYNDEGHIERVIGGFYSIYEYLSDFGGIKIYD